MGVTSLGRHTRPGCNLGFYVIRSINQDSDLVLYTVCVVVYLTSGDARGLGLTAVLKTMSRMRLHLLGGVT